MQSKTKLIVDYNSRTRGKHLVMVGLLLIAVPLVQEHFLKTTVAYMDIVFFTAAVIFFLLGIFRISQNIRYSFSIDSHVVRQVYAGHPSLSFTVNLRDIREIKKAKGSIGIQYFLIMEDKKRYQIPKIQDTNTDKIARRLEKYLAT
jgi:hypothetical protein